MKTITLYAFLLALKLLSYDSFSQGKKTKESQPAYNTYTQNKEAAEFFNKGKSYLENKDVENAISNLNKAIALDGKFIDAYDYISEAYLQKNDLSAAKFNSEKSLELFPEGSSANMHMGKVFETARDFNSALKYYIKSTRVSPDNPDTYYAAARMYYVTKDYHDAIINGMIAEKFFKKIKDPLVIDTQLLVGLAYYSAGNNKNAKKYLQKATDGGLIVPDNVKADLELE